MKVKRIVVSLLCTVLTAVTVLTGFGASVQAANETLLNTYGKTYGRISTCINYNQLTNSTVMNHVKSQYNSITLENEMKPDYILGSSASLISVSEAKNLGYYIPSGYTESYVPRLNFDTVDKTIKICYENGIGMRAHTLVWHSQTPAWFFRTGYSTNYGYVSQSQMNARMEFYIKSVMNHVYSSQYGSCVYAWDVVNEYFHATNSGWEGVYGKCGTKPEFVKRAFQYAYDCLDYYKLTDKVSLFYNDFNAYMEVNDVITMINYINSDKRICNGVGMQSHLGTTFPSVDYYTTALKSFLNAGFEVQITELDVTNSSSAEQASYIYNLMKNVNGLKKNGGKITGITIWGISDDVSWISGGKNPLLFSTLNNPKQSYYKFIQAYTEAGFAGGSSSGNTGSGSTGSGNKEDSSYATLADGWYYIKNVNAQKYLQVADNNGTAGANVVIGTGNGEAGQKWYVTNTDDGYVTLKNGNGGMLDIVYGKNEDGTNIQTYTANGEDAQKFKIVSLGNNQFAIVTKVSSDGKALDVYNFGTSDGANVCQWTYYKNENQIWYFEKCNN